MLVDSGDYHGLIFGRLREEHREIVSLLADVMRLDDDEARAAAFARLAQLIRIHDRAEDEIVYPVLEGSRELRHHMREDTKDHRAIDALLRSIEVDSAAGPGWQERLTALRAALDHHFADEEEYVFPRAHAVISSPEEQEMLLFYEQEREFLSRPR